MRGRTNPQVKGMDAGSADRRIFTGRAIPSRLRWLETICAHPSSTTGAERAATKASRARPARSFATIKRAPRVHKNSVNWINWPENGEAAAASITVEGNLGRGTFPPLARSEERRVGKESIYRW